MIRRRTIGVGLLIVVLAVAVLAGGLFLLGEYFYQDSYASEYEYDVRVTTNGTLTDATILVPAPALEGESIVAAELDDGAHAVRPEGVSSRIVETEHGPMLEVAVDEFVVEPEYYRFVEEDDVGWTEEIDADEYDPDDPDTFVRDQESVELTLWLESDAGIDTREPVGAEPLLEPRVDVTETTCESGAERCYAYASRTFLEYEADPTTAVSASVTFRGENSWWTGGWNGNWYEDRVTVEATGPQSGWGAASGELEAGWGSYR